MLRHSVEQDCSCLQKVVLFSSEVAQCTAMMGTTHVAYGDESLYNIGRYRSIGVVSLPMSVDACVTDTLRTLLVESGLREFKFQNLRQARERFAALRMVDLTIEQALCGGLRLDVLTWDTQDSRHRIKGRDDIGNLQRMYYHLLKNGLQRWSGSTSWAFRPDENSAMDWETVRDYVDGAGLSAQVTRQEAGLFRLRLNQDFRVVHVQEVDSRELPVCQLADLFAGLSTFSRDKFRTYCWWEQCRYGQAPLLPDAEPPRLSNSDQERCAVLGHFDRGCKQHKLGVSLKSKRGLWTPDPSNPINFWFYEPQHREDKAPTTR